MDTIHLHLSSSQADLAGQLNDLFRSVGYATEVHEGLVPRAAALISPPDSHVALLGMDETESRSFLAAVGAEARRPPTFVAVYPPEGGGAASRGDLVATGGVYDLFEQVAARLDISIGASAFVSYSRRDRAAADLLRRRLLESGRRVWIDRRDIHASEEWLQALKAGIQASDTFLFLASPASIASPHCVTELEWADEAGKRIIPVLLEPLSADELPRLVQGRQWIEVPAGASIESVADDVVRAVDRDPKLVRLHRQILGRALEWRRRGEDAHLLLRGAELDEAELWLGEAGASSDPRPSNLHSTYIAASRQGERKRQRTIRIVAGAVVAMTSALAVWAMVNRREAVRQSERSAARLAEQNAYAAFVEWDTDPVKAFLLADSAARTAPNSDPLSPAYSAMAASLSEAMPERVTNLETEVSEGALSPDLTRVAVAPVGGAPPFIMPVTGEPGSRVSLEDDGKLKRYTQLAFSADGSMLAGISEGVEDRVRSLAVWRASAGRRVATAVFDGAETGSGPEIVGFTGDGRHLLVERRTDAGYRTTVFAFTSDATLRPGPTWRSAVKLALGQVDLESGTLIQRLATRGNRSQVSLVDVATGRPRCDALETDVPVKQLHVAPGGKAFAVVEERHGSRVSSWTCSAGPPQPIGTPIAAPGPVSMWDLMPDGRSAVVYNAAADYRGEVWSFTRGTRVSIPVSNEIASPYIMKAGQEYRPIGFADRGRKVLTRAPRGDVLKGSKDQVLQLFDAESLELLAPPLILSIDYAVLQPSADRTRFATASREGLVEEWAVSQRPLPGPVTLPLQDLLLDARFLGEDGRLLTVMRTGPPAGYGAVVDLWSGATGGHEAQLPGRFSTRLVLAADPGTASVAIANRMDGEGTVHEVTRWRLADGQRLWATTVRAPIEALAFRNGGREIDALGQDETGVRIVTFDATSGRASDEKRVPLPPGSVHLAFSDDGDHLLADYDYSRVLIWDLNQSQLLVEPLSFTQAAGLPFDLGYDLVRGLRAMAAQPDGSISGHLSPTTPVTVRREGAGTTMVPTGSSIPILAAFDRSGARLYPVRGAKLVSPTGRWFALATNSTPIPYASALRVYALLSGYPVSFPLIHQVRGRPGAPWPALLSGRVLEADPILDVAFLDGAGQMLTITTNGVVRRWPLHAGRSDWAAATPLETGALLTGRILVSARHVARVPQSEYASLRERHAEDVRRIRRMR